jgi:chromosome partitioning protein
MGYIVAFLSQKGGVGKSTLARALACEASKGGLSVKVADLDTQQGTISNWHRQREANGHDRIGSVETFGKAKDALKTADEFDMLILDGAPRASSATSEIAKVADLIVLPTGASRDDLIPTVLLAHELTKKGIPTKKFSIALVRVATESEIRDAQEYIQMSGYHLLGGFLPEKPSYRQAQNDGLSVTETRYTSINEKAQELIQSIINTLTND